MVQMDKEYSDRIKELQSVYNDAKMLNQKGEKISPNVDLNSLYTYLWYEKRDVCKRILFHQVFTQ